MEASRRLGLVSTTYDPNGNFICIKAGGKALFFANYSTPFNSDSFSKISRDKEFTHLLLKDVIKMPKTFGIFDPNYNEDGEIKNNKEEFSKNLKKILEEVNFPLVVKPNSLSRGTNFALCKKEEEVLPALERVFNRNSRHYDFVALIQEYVEVKDEYRVIVYKNEIVLIYDLYKNVKTEMMKGDIENFIKPIFNVVDVGFAGLDIVVGKDGQMYLLEINAEPGFANFVGINGDEEIVQMYSKILKNP